MSRTKYVKLKLWPDIGPLSRYDLDCDLGLMAWTNMLIRTL